MAASRCLRFQRGVAIFVVNGADADCGRQLLIDSVRRMLLFG